MSDEIAKPIETETTKTVTEPIPTKEEFELLLGDGRKALAVENFEEACDKLGESIVLAVKLFGDFAAETYSPHFYYGKALLAIASGEKEILEAKLQDESVVQELKEGLQAMIETFVNQQDETPAEKEEVKESGDVSEQMEEKVGDVSEQMEEVDADHTLNKEDDDEDDEDVETAQLAFESLDYARLVCEKITDKSEMWLQRHKETYILLSQVALNEDNFATAIEDLNNALKIAETHFPNDLREASYIHLELGRIHRKNNSITESSSHIQKSIEALQKLKAKVQAESSEDPSLAEFDELLAELHEEKKLTQLRESENKENDQNQDPKTGDKSFETIQFKRKEKRPAEESIDRDFDPKKSKVGEASVDDVNA